MHKQSRGHFGKGIASARAVMMKVSASLLLVAFLATSCSTARHSREARFNDQERANLIVRYYTDETSYLLKPLAKDGPFLAVLNKDAVVELARQQTQRDLAVVVLIRYPTGIEADMVQQKWTHLLGEAGYQHVVFLRGRNGTAVNGLPIVGNGG
jgi:hypothetical protein